MWTIVAAAIGAAVKGALGAILGRLFPPKTAADQKVDDQAATLKEVKNANQISETVDQESRADVDSGLAQFVRKSD